MDPAIPFFKYHPHPLETGAFRKSDPPAICACCGRETSICYEGPFYSINNVDLLCPECIANGAAAKKFDGEFQDSKSVDPVKDPDKLDELIHRTPGYCGWQQEYWRAHCDDFCAFLGYVGRRELLERGLMDEVLSDPQLRERDREIIQTALTSDGSCQGYLFQCLHCGKHLLCYDFD